MTQFRYKARDRYGKSASGLMNGESKNAVARQLSGLGYVPISIDEAQTGTSALFDLSGFSKRVTIDELNLFTRQLLTLQRAGIALLSGLTILEKQTKNPYFKDVIKQIAVSVEGGASLSSALGSYPRIFGELYINMVKAGEASGLLDEILARLVEFGEREADTRSKVMAATRYPLITFGALIMAFFVMVSFVIPKFAAIFSQFGAALPLPTRVLLGISGFFSRYWFILIVVAVGVVVGLKRLISKGQGRLVWDGIKLKIPVFGPLYMTIAMSRFARTMSILTKSGLPILQVLELVSRTVDNTVISRTVGRIATSVREGKGISEPMSMSGIFPPIVVNMVAVGESTGKIDELLMRVSEYYDEQAQYTIKNLATIIEPIFVFILGCMVLTIALAIFLPMWNLISIFKQ